MLDNKINVGELKICIQELNVIGVENNTEEDNNDKSIVY